MSEMSRDLHNIQEKWNPDLADLLVRARRESGRSMLSIALDYRKLKKGRGKLRFYEYVLHGLHMKQNWTEDERDRFISGHIAWPIVKKCNNGTWWAVTEDKWLSSVFLESNGLPTTKNVAIFDLGPRLYPGLPKLRNAQDFKEFFCQVPEYPLFAKPIGGIWSAGAARIIGANATGLILDNKRKIAYDDVSEKLFGKKPYIVQECLKPHDFFKEITSATPTVRSLNLIKGDELMVPYTLLKLPQGENIADNFWRPGNILCNLDPNTGEVLNLVCAEKGRRIELDELPDKGGRKLVGERLPFWSDLQSLNEQCAFVHAENKIGSTDIALTQNGPVIVEVNNSCAFELIQIGTGSGLLTEEISDFFREFGADV